MKNCILLELFHNWFTINFSVIEIIIEVFVVFQKFIHVYMHNFCSCCINKF